MRHLKLHLAAILLLAFAARPAMAQSEQQVMVDRATLTVQEMILPPAAKDPRNMLRRARAVMICPQVLRIGFIFGGSGGACVLVARDGAGSWSYPGFYGIGSGSFGLQAGLQDSEFIMMILTDKGLNAVLDSQFKIGGDVSLAFADMGAGLEGSTTSAIGADIVAFSKTRGLFAGVSLTGSLLSVRSEWNRAYYGRDTGVREIVINMKGQNPGADPLREVLTRAAGPATAPAQTTEAEPATTSAPRAPVQQQSLAPPQSLALPKKQ